MRTILASALLALVFSAPPLHARNAAPASPVASSGVPGVGAAQLTPEFWIGLQAQPEQVILDARQIAAQNAALYARDPSMHDLRALPSTLSASQIRGWIEGLADPPTQTLYDVHGKPVAAATLQALVAARAGHHSGQPTDPLRHGGQACGAAQLPDHAARVQPR